MNSTNTRIARNAGVLFLSQLITWSLTLLLTIFLPRYLGPVNSGKFVFASALWAVAGVLITFGMDTYLTKEIARRADKVTELYGLSMVLRVVLYLVGFLGVAAFLYLFNYPLDTALVVFIIGISYLFWQFMGATQASLQGLEQMHYISLGYIAGKATSTLLSIVLLLLGADVYVIAAVAVLGAFVNFAVEFFFLRRLATLHLKFDFTRAKNMLRSSFPYLMSGLFLVAYGQVDVIIISLLVNEQTIGYYGAASQLFGTSFFIPTVFIAAVFPVLTRMYADTSDSLPRLVRRSFDLLVILSIPIGLGLFALAPQLVVLLFGPEFAPSGPILSVLGLVLIVTYLNMLIGQFLISMDRQNRWTVVMAVATVATIPLDLVLIPWCQATFGNGGIGGALSFLITEIGMFVFGLGLLPANSLDRGNAWLATRAMFAGIVMAIAAWLLRDLFIVIPIVVGALVYSGLALLLRVVSADDIALGKKLMQGILGKFSKRAGAPVA